MPGSHKCSAFVRFSNESPQCFVRVLSSLITTYNFSNCLLPVTSLVLPLYQCVMNWDFPWAS